MKRTKKRAYPWEANKISTELAGVWEAIQKVSDRQELQTVEDMAREWRQELDRRGKSDFRVGDLVKYKHWRNENGEGWTVGRIKHKNKASARVLALNIPENADAWEARGDCISWNDLQKVTEQEAVGLTLEER